MLLRRTLIYGCPTCRQHALDKRTAQILIGVVFSSHSIPVNTYAYGMRKFADKRLRIAPSAFRLFHAFVHAILSASLGTLHAFVAQPTHRVSVLIPAVCVCFLPLVFPRQNSVHEHMFAPFLFRFLLHILRVHIQLNKSRQNAVEKTLSTLC